ncbi:MAG: Holliday junction branch migration DNA helicase RuvB [Planctomycetes bacterium]|nr:Holliday junction branch migration DNA helicase RuvB [Planctomycetota bacterium]
MTDENPADVLERGATTDERDFEAALRPRRLAEFVGQRPIVHNLDVYLAAAKQRNEPLDHILFSGMPGLGKTTLAQLIAVEMGSHMHGTSGPVLERAGDLVGILTNLKRGDVLFVDEIHRLPAPVEEYLYSAMEDFHVDIQIDKGPAARSVRIDIQRFTLVGATTREGLLSSPFRARFGVTERLDPYEAADIRKIVERSAGLLKTEIDAAALELVSSRARGTPRVANRILRRLRDVAQVRARGKITESVAREGLLMLGIDEYGLTEMDRRILRCLADQGGPAGLRTVAVAVGEEEDTIEDAYEPHLIREGLIQVTPRGRKLTEKGKKLAK